MPFYKKHVFFCTNQKDKNKKCCQMGDASVMCQYAKERIKALDMGGEGGIRVSSSGCLGRCEEGPCVVIYPEGVWYTYQTQEDIEEILQEHCAHGHVVDRLLINKDPSPEK